MAAVSPAGIVTPEAVLLQLETAGAGSRLVAKVIDVLIQVVLLVVLALGSSAVGAAVGHIGLALVFVSLFVVLFVYPIGFETLWRGRTPGKAVLGLRVVTVEGAPIRFRHAAIRAFMGLIDIYLLDGVIGLISILVSSRNQRLGDLVAGTVVLRERTAAAAPAPATFFVPPGYEAYAASLDVSVLTAAEYGAARSFLLRAHSLEPGARYELARQLATPMVGRVGSAPPSWVSPEAFLVCVVAMVQHRAGWAPPPGPRPPPPQGAPPPQGPPPPPVRPAPDSDAPDASAPDSGYVPPS